MIALVWRKVGPWATPLLVVVEIALVWSGLLRVGTAVLIGVMIEALLWVTAASRAFAGVRLFRAGRAAGADPWRAAEDGLAQLIPRRAAHLILIEPRLWISLARWISGRHDGKRAACAFRYDAALRGLLWSVVGLVIVEGTVLEFVLALLVGNDVWLVVSSVVHLYAVLGLLGVLASFATRPHVLERDLLRVRDGVFSEVLVPYSVITGARVTNRSSFRPIGAQS